MIYILSGSKTVSNKLKCKFKVKWHAMTFSPFPLRTDKLWTWIHSTVKGHDDDLTISQLLLHSPFIQI